MFSISDITLSETSFLGRRYPIVWGFAEGSNTITPNAEVSSCAALVLVPFMLPFMLKYVTASGICILNADNAGSQAFCYGGLDVCTKVFFGWAIIFMGPILRRQNEEEYAKCDPSTTARLMVLQSAAMLVHHEAAATPPPSRPEFPLPS